MPSEEEALDVGERRVVAKAREGGAAEGRGEGRRRTRARKGRGRLVVQQLFLQHGSSSDLLVLPFLMLCLLRAHPSIRPRAPHSLLIRFALGRIPHDALYRARVFPLFLPYNNRAVLLLALVGRSKQCFDFTATLHGFHLLACVLYGGWPRSVFWWALNITTLILMAVLGEYLCMRRELLPITLAGQDLSRPGAARAGSARRVGAGPTPGGGAEEHVMQDLRPAAGEP